MIAKADKELKLTELQERFAINMFTYGLETYGNATQSAKKAGYKGNDKTLSVVGSENLAKPCIIARKAQIQALACKKVDVSRNRCLKELADILSNKDEKTTDKLKAISLIGDFGGYKRELGINPEREALRKAFTDTEKQAALDFAHTRMLDKAKNVVSVVVERDKE